MTLHQPPKDHETLFSRPRTSFDLEDRATGATDGTIHSLEVGLGWSESEEDLTPCHAQDVDCDGFDDGKYSFCVPSASGWYTMLNERTAVQALNEQAFLDGRQGKVSRTTTTPSGTEAKGLRRAESPRTGPHRSLRISCRKKKKRKGLDGPLVPFLYRNFYPRS